MLIIFKDMQTDADGNYNELFFVQHRDPSQEQWTGKRLGVEGVKANLVLNGFTLARILPNTRSILRNSAR